MLNKSPSTTVIRSRSYLSLMYQATSLACVKTLLIAIRVNIDDTPINDRLLQALPVIGIEQFGMQLIEDLAQLWISEHEGAKFLGKNITGPNRVPRLAGKLLSRIRRLGNMAEVALREVAHLVVVVKDHASMAGHTEVLQQHIARKDIRRRHLLDGVAVVLEYCAGLNLIALLQIQVERSHHALGITVLDDHLVALELHGRRGHFQQVVKTLRIEVILARNEIGKLLGISHSTDPIMALHQTVLLAHDVVGDILGRVETILDDLEHRTKRSEEHTSELQSRGQLVC